MQTIKLKCIECFLEKEETIDDILKGNSFILIKHPIIKFKNRGGHQGICRDCEKKILEKLTQEEI